MRVAFLTVILSVSTLLSSAAQQTSSASSQPLQILHQALAAFTGTTPASDVTLSGTVQYIAGADDETGTAVLKALAAGASRVDLQPSVRPAQRGPQSHGGSAYRRVVGPRWR